MPSNLSILTLIDLRSEDIDKIDVFSMIVRGLRQEKKTNRQKSNVEYKK